MEQIIPRNGRVGRGHEGLFPQTKICSLQISARGNRRPQELSHNIPSIIPELGHLSLKKILA